MTDEKFGTEKKLCELVDLIIEKRGLPDSIKREVRKIAVEKKMRPIEALLVIMDPLFALEDALAKMSEEQQKKIVKSLMILMSSYNWQEELEVAAQRVIKKKLKQRPQ